jgi:SAM-dependent methyltransferase
MDLVEKYNLNSDSFVVELASNDGYLLKNYVQNKIPCLGIDPAEGPAKVAQKNGIPTLIDFFSESLALELSSKYGKADVIHANNILAHVADTNGFVRGIATLIKEKGVAVIEVPYIKDLIENCEFDTIYHEHLCYFSVTALNNLFRQHNMYLNEIERIPIHGGSLRLFVQPKEKVDDSVLSMLEEEKDDGLDQLTYYQGFARRIEQLRGTLKGLLNELKQQDLNIAAYGAAAKGSTLINYMGIGNEYIDFIVDRNTYKHGLYMPGQHIPIHGTDMLLERMPNYVLMLSWNFAEEIIKQQQEYIQRGGKFIIPIPEVHIK